MSPSANLRETNLKFIHLWGVAVGSAIGGDFLGWNSCLISGLGGALIGLLVSTALYFTLSLCIAEMSATAKNVRGSHSFVIQSPLGRFGGYLTGMAELLKIIPTGCVCVFAIASYVMEGLATFHGIGMEILIWIVCYFIFTALNVMGIELSVKFQVVITISSIALLLGFFIPSLFFLDLNKYALKDLGKDGWFLGDTETFFISLPYSLWWYLGIESIPLLSKSVQNPAKEMPRSIIWSMITLLMTGGLTLVLNTSVAPGIDTVRTSEAPLLDGFKAISDNSSMLVIISALVSLGLIVSFHCFVLYAGETVAQLGADGILPACLSSIHPRYGTPHVALLSSSVLGLLILALAAYGMPREHAVSVLINAVVVGALISYILQFLAYLTRNPEDLSESHHGGGIEMSTRSDLIDLESSGTSNLFYRRRTTQEEQCFRNPLGKAGAILGGTISVAILGAVLVHARRDVDEAKGVGMALGFLFLSMLVYIVQASRFQLETPSDARLEMSVSVNSLTGLNMEEREKERETSVRGGGSSHDPLGFRALSSTQSTPTSSSSSPQRRSGPFFANRSLN